MHYIVLQATSWPQSQANLGCLRLVFGALGSLRQPCSPYSICPLQRTRGKGEQGSRGAWSKRSKAPEAVWARRKAHGSKEQGEKGTMETSGQEGTLDCASTTSWPQPQVLWASLRCLQPVYHDIPTHHKTGGR